MAAYQERLRNHLWVASWEETFVTPEPHPDQARATCTNRKGVSQAAFFPKALNHFLASILTGIMDLSDTLTLPSSPHVPSWHITMLLFLQNTPTYRVLHSLAGQGRGGRDVCFCYLYFCGVLLTQASRPAAEGAGATGNVHPDTNG